MVTDNLPPVRRKVHARSAVGPHFLMDRTASVQVLAPLTARVVGMLLVQALQLEPSELHWETLSITMRKDTLGYMQMRAYLEVSA